GAALLAWAAIPLWQRLSRTLQITVLLLIAFIAPYFVTWFWSYSYHPRLSFPIVPSMLVLLAVLIDSIQTKSVAPSSNQLSSSSLLSLPRGGKGLGVRGAEPRRLRSFAPSILIIVLSLPGIFAGLTALPFVVTGVLPNDHEKIAQGNPALMGLVDSLPPRRDPNRYPAALKRPMNIQAPGELRLPYFFPNDDIRTEDYPLALDQIADVDYFIDSS